MRGRLSLGSRQSDNSHGRKRKLFSRSMCTESLRSKEQYSQESNVDIDGFSSSSSSSSSVEGEVNMRDSIRNKSKVLKSPFHVNVSVDKGMHGKVEEWQDLDINMDEDEDIAWSNSSSDDEHLHQHQYEEKREMDGDNDENEVEQFRDITLMAATSSKRPLDVTIKEYGSDEELPVKLKPQHCDDNAYLLSSSQQTIEELSPSPAYAHTTPLLLTGKTEIFKSEPAEFPVDEYSFVEEESVKKRKMIKDGLAERLQKIIAREKSDVAFWTHDTKGRQKNEGVLIGSVMAISSGYSTTCLRLSFHHGTCCYIVVPSTFLERMKISQDSILHIYPPWKRIFCADLKCVVLLCVYHIEVQGPPSCVVETKASEDLLQFHERHMEEIISGGASLFDNYQTLNLSTLETTYLPTSQTPLPTFYTIVEAVERNGISKYLSLAGLIQRVLCASVSIASQDKTSFSNKIALSQENDQKEQRFGLLIQDNSGCLCEVLLPTSVTMNKVEWKSVITEGEGKFCLFHDIRLVRRRTHAKSSSLRSMMESLRQQSSSPVHQELGTGKDSIEDSLEDSSTQNVNQQCSSSYLFILDESSSLEFHPLPDGYHIPYVDCAKPVSPLHTLVDGRYLVNFKLVAFVTNVEDNCQSSVSELCFFYGMCTSKDCYQVHSIKKLSVCVVPSRLHEMMKTSTSNMCICFKDLYVCKGQPIADAYTRIYLLNHDGSDVIGTPNSMKCDLSVFKGVPEPMVAWLENNSRVGDLVQVRGIICGVDEETALFWSVCDECGSDEVLENEAGEVWCEGCEKQSSSEMKMQLDVFLFLTALPKVCVLCKLLESTIRSLLPGPSGGDFEGYDMKSVLSRNLGPLLCQVVDIIVPSKQQNEQKIFLKQVACFESVGHYE